jgi:hypothetical protein
MIIVASKNAEINSRFKCSPSFDMHGVRLATFPVLLLCVKDQSFLCSVSSRIFLWPQIAQRVVRPDFVVPFSPVFDLSLSFLERLELVGVEPLLSEAGIVFSSREGRCK